MLVMPLGRSPEDPTLRSRAQPWPNWRSLRCLPFSSPAHGATSARVSSTSSSRRAHGSACCCASPAPRSTDRRSRSSTAATTTRPPSPPRGPGLAGAVHHGQARARAARRRPGARRQGRGGRARREAVGHGRAPRRLRDPHVAPRGRALRIRERGRWGRRSRHARRGNAEADRRRHAPPRAGAARPRPDPSQRGRARAPRATGADVPAEELAILWIHLATVGKRGRDFAFKTVPRPPQAR